MSNYNNQLKPGADLEYVEGIGPHIAGHYRLRPALDDELSCLDTRARGSPHSRVVNALERHRLAVHEDISRTTAKDRTGLCAEISAVCCNDYLHLCSSDEIYSDVVHQAKATGPRLVGFRRLTRLPLCAFHSGASTARHAPE